MKIYALSFKNDILEFIADRLVAENSHNNNIGQDINLSEYAVVFPGKRPALYLESILSEKMHARYYPPAMFSMDEFIKFIAEKDGKIRKEIDEVNASWFLYKILKNIIENGGGDLSSDLKFIKEIKGFEDFLSWGIFIYNAINELDAGLVESDKIKKIKSFNYQSIPENLSRFYGYLASIRNEFHEKLSKEKLAAPGLNCIDAHAFINKNENFLVNEFKNFKKIYFVGLSFPSKAEAGIIKKLVDAGIAEIYTQVESLSYEESAGQFKNFYTGGKKTTGAEKTEIEFINYDNAAARTKSTKEDSLECPFDLKLYEAGNTHSELLVFNKILTGGRFEPEKTAVVMPDSGMLIPFLHHVLKHIDSGFNITMGYPLKRTPFYSLVRLIFNAQEFIDGGAGSMSGGGSCLKYSVKDYLRLIKHPYIKKIGGAETLLAINEIEKYIYKNGKSAVTLEDIENNFKDKNEKIFNAINYMHKYFFRNFEFKKISVKNFTANLLEITKLIVESGDILTYEFSPEFTKKFIETVDLFGMSYFKNELLESKSVFRLFKYYLDGESIAFDGIPLKGMQIMGILETRVLKFKTAVVFDVNENVLPPVKKFDAVLPYEIRKELGLFTYGDYESIYRHHFRRLILGSEEAHIVYIKNNKQIRSRFVEEIIWDQEKKSKNLDIEKKITSLSFESDSFCGKNKMASGIIPCADIGIIKTDEILKAIGELTNKLSASAIDTYINCPVQFYYKYIIRLEEAEMLKQNGGADKIGLFVHGVLKIFYQKIKEKRYDFDRLLADENYLNFNINAAIEDQENIGGPVLDLNAEEYFLIKETAKNILYGFIKNDLKASRSDKNSFNWHILELEAEKTASLKIHSKNEGSQKEIKLYGKIDRIDKYNYNRIEGYVQAADNKTEAENLLIIDYKTGKRHLMPDIKKILLYSEESGADSLKDRNKIKKIIKSFQLPVYIYLVKSQKREYDYNNINACLNLMQEIKDYDLSAGAASSNFARENRFYLLDGRTKNNSDIGMKDIMEELLIPLMKYIVEEILNKGMPFMPDNSDPAICRYCPYALLCGII